MATFKGKRLAFEIENMSLCFRFAIAPAPCYYEKAFNLSGGTAREERASRLDSFSLLASEVKEKHSVALFAWLPTRPRYYRKHSFLDWL